MASEPVNDRRQVDTEPARSRRPWSPPALIHYGSLRKLTQSFMGSTGESGNFTMRMLCL
jgi:hypothetical protein